jgi:hypothetical protein
MAYHADGGYLAKDNLGDVPDLMVLISVDSL